MGVGGGGHWLVQMEWRPAGRPASVNLPLHHKVQKFSSGTVSPGWSWKKGRKTVVIYFVHREVKFVENQKLYFGERTQSKCGSLDYIDHIPGGGDRMIGLL